ncbi:MAG: right-handed parallel beta-helix repeat-containing protein [Sedimentisphaerales bacterium]
MKSKLIFCVSLLMLVQAAASAATITVPSRTYQTIQSAINASTDGDIVILQPGVYTGSGNVNLDLHGHAITVMSTVNPNDPCWGTINATIIDCGGMPYGPAAGDTGNANRAFQFVTNEGPGSQVIGITIKNGYARGPKAKDAQYGFIGDTWLHYPNMTIDNPWETFPPYETLPAGIDPCTLPPAALNGSSATGNAYGGAIYCHNTSPTIQYCVIENCTVTGALGGAGAAGISGPWNYYTWADFNWVSGGPNYQKLLATATLKNSTNGQAGGNGGMGTGNGYGGAIAMLGNNCSPEIDNCRFINNSAQGAQGGAGGAGGNAAYAPFFTSGLEGAGGNAGDSNGEGFGGAIYAESFCQPTFNNCLFSNNLAKTGPRGQAGGRGQGNINIVTTNGGSNRVSAGHSSIVYAATPFTLPAGGAGYFLNLSGPIFNDCNFISNKAYIAFADDPLINNGNVGWPLYEYDGEDILGYTVGGAIYFSHDCQIEINTCDFIKNGGDALYFEHDCTSSSNTSSAISNDAAVGSGQLGRKNLFKGNIAPDDVFIGSSTYGGTFHIYIVPSSGSGGAIYMNPNCEVTISNSIFNGNSAKENGGAIETQSDLTISDCAFSDNSVSGNGDFTGFGGAVDVYSDGTALAIDVNNCSFIGNKSLQGGALSTENFYGGATSNGFDNCIFTNNTAQIGGALELSMGQSTVMIADSNFSGNTATSGNGGAIDCFYTSADINSCEFFSNSTEGTFTYGGGINLEGYDYSVGGHTIINSLFAGNSSSYDGGAIACEDDSVAPLIQNCTFSQNTASQSGGSIYADSSAAPQIKDSIFQKSNKYAIYKDNAGGSTKFSLFYNNPDGNYYPVGVSDTNNLTGNPLFVTGTLGNYYLSQIAAGQTANSPAVNAGDVNASALGLNTKTTATNDVCDSGRVDLGYHFSRAVNVPQFSLTTSVVSGIGTISVLPAPLPDGNYYAGTVVTITTTPQAGWVVKRWTGTDNDSEVTATQTVVMNSNRAVTVEFKQPTYLYVGPYNSYSDIPSAITEANDGDIIVVSSDFYNVPEIQFTKAVELRSAQPDNPTYVANTVLDFAGRDGPGIFFPQGMNSGCILNGFTIQNVHTYTDPGDDSSGAGQNGGDGRGNSFGGIWIGPGAGPIIKNCIITHNTLDGGFGGNGGNADTYHNAGRGGWGGWARGAGVYCAVNSYPQFINCQILNNRVAGGFGGTGGNVANPGGAANYGGNWSSNGLYNPDYDPRDLTYDWVRGDLWARWTELAPYIPDPAPKLHAGDNYSWRDDYWHYTFGYIGDYRYYSGYGGGVYVNKGSNVTFTNCIISGNLAEGGFSGQGGVRPSGELEEPRVKYEIPAFGGGVYVAATSNVVFNGCLISNNTASDPNFDHTIITGAHGASYLPTGYNPSSHFHIDSYLGHGGGVAAEDSATVTFIDCNFNNNNASLGGGLFGSNASLVVNECNFMSNTAYQGGGMFGQNGSISINGSIFSSNISSVEANDSNVIGQGGALDFLSANANIVDTNISGNIAQEIGGGLYLGGSNSTVIHNCIVINNSAGQMGGAVAAGTSAQVQVANCTIANNIAVADMGGGLLSSDGSYVNVINSILWDNKAGLGANGNQIAVDGTDSPASMQVTYSDVQDANDPCAWTNNVNALDFVICFDTTGSMGGDITAVGNAASQIVSKIAASFASYRLALVDFRDYPDGNHGALTDWAYRDRVRFTTDANALINGIQQLVAGGGADNPEAIYTALMHSMDPNALVARLTANGYANYIDLNSPGLGDWRPGNMVIRVIMILSDAPPHDPEPYTNYVLNDIITAATGENPIHIIPVVIRDDPTAVSALSPVATGTGGILIPTTDDSTVPAAVLRAISLLSQVPTPIFIGPNSVINWNPATVNWNSGSNNINADPYFINGYFLSQIAAGQLVNSPCVDTGSADVNSPAIDLGGYTTRTDSVPDMCTVDMGYHYSAFTPTQYYLNFTAVAGNGLGAGNILPGSGYFDWFKTIPLQVTIPVPTGSQVLWTGTNNDNLTGPTNSVTMNGNRTVTVAFVSNSCHLTVVVVGNNGGTVTPISGTYARGTVVTLTATPAPGYRIDNWQGTDNDGSYSQTNTVTMNGDKTVYVTFSLPQTLTVPGTYSSIQDAIEAARSGDIVSVASGVYHGTQITINKEITIASTNPDDPCVVAATVISSSGYANIAVVFESGSTGNTVLDGFTITGGTYNPIDAIAPTGAGANGNDGYSIGGGAVYIYPGASPTIRNCVIRDTNITGGNATNGNAADATHPAGRGGWAGGSYGGGVFVDSGASPTFINCTVTNCSARGGNAGNGGDSAGTYGSAGYEDANHGGSWSDANTFPYQSLIGSNGLPYSADYEFYSGLGGGVFCNANSMATFIDCNIINNVAIGGMSGIGGNRPYVRPDPVTAYRIPSYGGGVFCANNASVYFIGCNITGNVSPKPDATYHVDPYLGHGGGIAFVDGADVQIENCTISGNTSSVGGGVFWIGGSPAVLNCNIINNIAYVGGGIYATESSGQISDCSFSGNFAGVSPNDVDVVAGQGGGIFGSSMNADIIDCVLNNNISSASGAGIHIYGPASTETIIRNCLLTNNQSGRDGAGISVNWGAIAVVENCTLYDNQVTGLYGVPGDTGFGGGLYCSYDASTDVNNSIFWDDNSLFGPEIYIGTDTNHEPTCGSVTITYSDIQGGQAGVYVGNIGTSCPFTWGAGNINIDPQFVSASGDDFHLKNTTAGQTVNSPCIDAGGNPAQLHGLFKYTTSTLGTPDMGVVDLGYHYPIVNYCRQWDLFIDNAIDFRDLAVFASSWVGALGNEIYGYNITDLADFTECWLVELPTDVTPPTPNPMTWAIPPRVSTATLNSVEMKATLASDASGAVYYQFEDVNGTPTAWQVDPCYKDTGLNPTGEYCFRVRAKDKYNNMTAWSDYNSFTGLGCVTNIGDVNAPSPAPTMLYLPSPSGSRDDNSTSQQFQWSASELDWWHKIVVDVTGITDNVTPADQIEVRFICSDSDFSSNNVIPITYRPIRIGHPVSIGARIQDGVGVQDGSYRLTWNGANQIVYDVFVNSYGGGVGVPLYWKVCVYDSSGNSICSSTNLLSSSQ